MYRFPVVVLLKTYTVNIDTGSGGGGGIRTPETLAGLTVFKTAAFNRSATPPRRGPEQVYRRGARFCKSSQETCPVNPNGKAASSGKLEMKPARGRAHQLGCGGNYKLGEPDWYIEMGFHSASTVANPA